MAQRAHFVENTTKTPNIAFAIVLLLLHNLRRHVVWSANSSLCLLHGPTKDPRNAEISHFNNPRAGEKNILRLEVSVQDLSVVDMLYCQTYLHKPIEHLRLLQQPSKSLLQVVLQVAAVRVLHHNA